MAAAFVQAKTASQTGFSITSKNTGNMSGSVVSGNRLYVFIRDGNAGGNPATPTDTLGTTYTLVLSDTSQDPRLWCYEGAAPSSGTNDVTVTWGGGGNGYVAVGVVEVSGANAASDSDNKTGSGTSLTTDAVLDAPSTGALLLLFGSQNALNSFTAAGDFTLIDGSFTNNLAGLARYSPAGTLSNYAADRLVGSGSATWTALAVVIPASGGGGSSSWGDHNFRGSGRGVGMGVGRGVARSPYLSLEAYRREQAAKHREFMAKVRRAA